MSRYRCPFYGYSMKNDPQYKLTRFCKSVLGRIQPFLHIGVRTKPDSKAFQNSLSSLLFIHNFRPFWPSCGGRVFRNGKQRFFNSFPGSGLYFVCRCPFHGYIGEKMPGDGWRLIECAISCLFSMTISMKMRPRTWNTYFYAYSWMCRFHGYSEEKEYFPRIRAKT